MALSKTYYCQANCLLDDNSTAKLCTASWLFAIKTFLTGLKTGTTGTNGTPPGSAAWTVTASSDSVTAGAGDNLGGGTFVGAKWVRANVGVAHSWYVLRSPDNICAVLGTQVFYLIVDWASGNDNTYNIFLSKTEPTGGSTTLAPTSADQFGMTAHSMPDVAAGTRYRVNYVTDARGNFHITYSRGASNIFQELFWVSETVAPGIATGELWPITIGADTINSGRGAGSTGALTATQGWNGANGCVTRSPLGTVPNGNQGIGIMMPVNSNFLTGIVPNQASSMEGVIACKVYYYNSTSTLSAHKGRIPDWWLGNSTNAVGSVSPTNGASEHINVGYLWIPNGGVLFTV